MIQDGDELPFVSRVQDVAVDLEVLHHQVHQAGTQLHGDDVGPLGVLPLQGGSRHVRRLQLQPLLPGEDVVLLQPQTIGNMMVYDIYHIRGGPFSQCVHGVRGVIGETILIARLFNRLIYR